MAKTLKAILNKKSWTGKDVGIVLLLNHQHELEELAAGKRAPIPPIVPIEKFNEMWDYLQTAPELFREYLIYESFSSFIASLYDRNQCLRQQFYNGFNRLRGLLAELERSEDAKEVLRKLPLILTQEEYDQTAAEIIKKKSAEEYSFITLMAAVLAAVLGEPERAPAEVREALKSTKAEQVTNSRILENYNMDTSRGYVVYKDGKRSDELTHEEEQARMFESFQNEMKLNYPLIIKNYELLYKGSDAIKAAYKEKYGVELPELSAETIEEEFEKAVKGTSDYLELDNLANDRKFDEDPGSYFHFYEEPPEGLTKYDILTDLDTRGRYFGFSKIRMHNGAPEKDLTERQAFKEFKTDYPALYKALSNYIIACLPKAGELKANQLHKNFVTAGELSEAGVIGFSLCDLKDYDFMNYYNREEAADYIRACQAISGIALLRPDSTRLMKSFKSKYASQISEKLMTFEKFAQSEELTFEATRCLAIVEDALQNINTYNYVIKIIAKELDVSFIADAATVPIDSIQDYIEGYNTQIYKLYANIGGCSNEVKANRLTLREYFKPIEKERCNPRPSDIARFKKDFKALPNEERARFIKFKAKAAILDIVSRQKGGRNG